MINRRPKKEVLAFYDGQISAYEMLLKIWPLKKDEIVSFLAMGKAMRKTAEGDGNEENSRRRRPVKLSNFIDGLQTLAPYYEDGDGYYLGAEHDIFYAYATKKQLTTEDVQKMIDLGWFQPRAATGDDEDFKAQHYDAEESWAAYT